MRKNLLIVEHDPDILHVLTLIFQGHGYSVTAFPSEEGVLEKIKTDKPDVIVLDIFKPTPESTVLCREIKADDKLNDIPVIALSTHMDAHKIHSIYADKVLGKPFDITELVDVVESQIMA